MGTVDRARAEGCQALCFTPGSEISMCVKEAGGTTLLQDEGLHNSKGRNICGAQLCPVVGGCGSVGGISLNCHQWS